MPEVDPKPGAAWVQDDRSRLVTRTSNPLRRRLRFIALSLANWLDRRPGVVGALVELRPGVLVRSALAPKLSRFRTRLRPGSTSVIGDRNLRSLVSPIPERSMTPVAFPQDTAGDERRIDDLPADTRPGARQIASLRRRGRVVLAPTVLERSLEAVRCLAKAGTPMVVDGIAVDSPLPSSLVSALQDDFEPIDHRQRELQSIRIRRAAWSAEMKSPTVSVLLASRRPGDLHGAIEMVAAQRGCDVELLVGLHGSRWEPSVESELESRWGSWLTTERFDEATDFGTVLRTLESRATGEYVAKWDDDDLYGADHLLDLVLAKQYSGAELVGKAAEFVYLEGLDKTIRRLVIGAERFSTTLAGGALLLERDHLRLLGGWPAGTRRVDGLLIDAVLAAGGSCYRSHGFQFILRRRPEGAHTWDASDEYFLEDAVDQWSGLALGSADIVAA